MEPSQIIWDLEDDPEGNYWHIVVEGHGLTADDVDEVLTAYHSSATRSHSSGLPITFGETSTGRYIAVVFEYASRDPLIVRPVTAYEAPRPKGH
jgi:hypothetical protein